KREIIRSRKTVFDRLAFFFSSRRRHTRFSRDWSSDVCSSDLDTVPPENRTLGWPILEWVTEYVLQPDGPQAGEPFTFTDEQVRRSEERRVGKECRSWWATYDEKEMSAKEAARTERTRREQWKK